MKSNSFDSSMDDYNQHDGLFVADQTYEATRARRSASNLADKVTWDERLSFRGQPYRHLHHQKGLIGKFQVRLLEARALKRSHWSPLALGPAKHFGLSKAHGPVSSYCTFQLDFVSREEEEELEYRMDSSNNNNMASSFLKEEDQDKKPAAKPGTKSSGSEYSFHDRNSSNTNHNTNLIQKSPVVPCDDNPVWDNCRLEFPLFKTAMPLDGMRIKLRLRVKEESTAVENILPPIVGGGGEDGRMLGVGELDITALCLGQSKQGQTLPGIQEAWIPIAVPGKNQGDIATAISAKQQAQYYHPNDPLAPPATDLDDGDDENKYSACKDGGDNTSTHGHGNSNSTTGRVRVLVSYEPHGIEPQKNDIVALECFARRHLPMASCRPVLFPPLQPMKVLERQSAYLLLSTLSSNNKKGQHCIRLHRNAIFVVERTNLVDAAHNLALLPTDVFLSTPLGHAVEEIAGPVVLAGKEMLMPAFLSLKLFWMALRTTALASFSGVQALGHTFWEEGTNSLLSNNSSNNSNNNSISAQRNNHPTSTKRSGSSAGSSRSSSSSSVKLVQL